MKRPGNLNRSRAKCQPGGAPNAECEILALRRTRNQACKGRELFTDKRDAPTSIDVGLDVPVD